jgi:DNA (cytosine-5)-methyltransferase 1
MTSKLRLLDLFSGLGAFSLGLERSGLCETVAFCEKDEYCRAVLRRHWPEVPIYDDVCILTADALQRDGIAVDAICGGFPCQDISRAGTGLGLDGERSGLWSEYSRLIRELRPKFVFVENVAALLDRELGDVLRDLSVSGYDAEWSIVSACSMGAPHMRQRVFIVAYPNGFHGRPRLWHSTAHQNRPIQEIDSFESSRARFRARLANPSELYRGADGLAHGMERNRAIGNSLLPKIPELIGHAILEALQ